MTGFVITLFFGKFKFLKQFVILTVNFSIVEKLLYIVIQFVNMH